MTTRLKITAIGDSLFVELPAEVMERLCVAAGDSLYLTETADGIELRALDSAFAEDMEIAEQIMIEDRDVLRRLAE
jgi:putative addiction module antidote